MHTFVFSHYLYGVKIKSAHILCKIWYFNKKTKWFKIGTMAYINIEYFYTFVFIVLEI